MKKTLLVLGVISLAHSSFSQQQIANSDFESWESVSSGQEAVNWNSFLTAGGSFSWAASDQYGASTDVRPGTTGTKSARIFSNSVLSVIANGNFTTGKINMGSTTPANSSNYNSSITADADFSEAFTDSPDSLVFWAKFTPASGNTTDSARVSAIIHDNYDLRDPLDANSVPHVVATAIKNYGKTDGNWVRIAVPFIAGPATTPAYFLITFTTNMTPGGGSDNDEVLIDDMQLIYNSNSIGESTVDLAQVSILNHQLVISTQESEGAVSIYTSAGQLVHQGAIDDAFTFQETGMYIVQLVTENGTVTKKVINY